MPLNPHIADFKDDPIYHFGLNKNMRLVDDPDLQKTTLPELFGDTRIVCMGGSPIRAQQLAIKLSSEFAKRFAKALAPEFDIDPDDEDNIRNLSLNPERLHLYKIGPILSVSHGMGIGSCRIAVHEIIKLLFYAGKDSRKIIDQCEIIRIGSSGGIKAGLGDVVIGRNGIHPRTMKPVDEIYYMGKTYSHTARFDDSLRQKLYDSRNDINVIVGDILTANCFYREEPNLRGAVLVHDQYTEEYLQRDIIELRRRNIAAVEMEASALAGICGPDQAHIPSADICAVYDPMGTPVESSKKDLKEFSSRAEQVVINYITSRQELFV